MDILQYAHRLSSSELERRMYIENHPMHSTLFDRIEPMPAVDSGIGPAPGKAGRNWLNAEQTKFPQVVMDEMNALVSARSVLNYYHGMLVSANINNSQLINAIQSLQAMGILYGDKNLLDIKGIIANLAFKPFPQMPIDLNSTNI